MKLYGYILSIVGTRILAAAAILLGILQVLELLDATPEILERGLGLGGVAYHALLRLPRMLEQAAPLAVLAGALFAFGQLAREQAVTAMRAAGVSVYRLLAVSAVAGLGVLVVDLMVLEVVAPRTDLALANWWRATAAEADRAEPGLQAFRSGDELVVARASDEQGNRLDEVRIYRRDGQGQVSERIAAPMATYGAEGWRLDQPSLTRFTEGEAMASTAEALIWPTPLRPADVRALLFSDQATSGAIARRALGGVGSERPESYYAVRVHRTLAEPMAVLVMLLLAAPVALANFRTTQGAVLSAAALAAGLTFLVLDGLLTALGEGGALAPVLAAWTAPAVFAAMAATVLLRMEG
ncbi:MAG: LptF/LptG family permease [Phenylobacterium sp.]|uniref:LptF/LptG family permease n=1 Tax=Phenylobacterium sp. TaxID=1871053 RepID=UPI00271BAE1C|nr:LptF/LptG family permease [Phenylobacterium sp.]MDO8411753.1 LptF/LptG family permease [Phenylobacterium sp.]